MRLVLKETGVEVEVVVQGKTRLPDKVEVEWSRLPSRVQAQLSGRSPNVVLIPPEASSSTHTSSFQELKDALALARTANDVIVICDSDEEGEEEEGEEEGMVLVGMLGSMRILPHKLVVTVSGDDQVVGYLVRGGGASETKVSDMLSPARRRRKRKRESPPLLSPPSSSVTAAKKIKTLVPPPPATTSSTLRPPLPAQTTTTPTVNRRGGRAIITSSSSSSSSSSSQSPPVVGAYEGETEDDEDQDEEEGEGADLNRRTTFLLFQLYIHSNAATLWNTEPHVTRVLQALSNLPGVQVPTKSQLTHLLHSWGTHDPPIERHKMRKINGLQAGLLMGIVHKDDAWPTSKDGWKDLGTQLQACGVVGGGMEEFSPTYLKKKRRSCAWLSDASVRQAVAYYSSVMGGGA